MKNIFQDIPANLPDELMQPLLTGGGMRLLRIVSRGHSSPVEGWYDQDDHEWVMVLQGQAELAFEDGRRQHLVAGDYLLIPAHCRHRVAWTPEDRDTVWLALHYRDGKGEDERTGEGQGEQPGDGI